MAYNHPNLKECRMKTGKLLTAAVCLFLVFAAPVFAQTAAELDILLNTAELGKAKAARFVLGTMQMLPAGLSGEAAEREAFKSAQEKGWVKGSGEELISLKDTAFLIMKAFNLKGGFMYAMAKNPRYAYRELIYRRIIQGRSDPAMKVSGKRLLAIIDRALQYSGEGAKLDAQFSGGGK